MTTVRSVGMSFAGLEKTQSVNGGGGSSRRILAVNTEFINELRGKQNLPPLPPETLKLRPREIKNLIVAEDDPDQAEITGLLVSCLITELSDREAKVQNLREIGNKPLPTDRFNIILAITQPEIVRVPEFVLSHDIGLTVTDFNMPGLTGEQVAASLRQHNYNGFLIGMTGVSGNMNRFYRANVDLALMKPLSRDFWLNLFS
jgi:CheY-like chemotaxis protein